MSLKTADRWFSKFIRLRDADDDGIIICISCGIPIHWKKADAGHFIERGKKAVRFDEKNVNGQCTICNWIKEGNKIEYAKGLAKKYGKGIVEKLQVLQHRTIKMGSFELKHIADYYRDKFNQLKKLKGL